MKTCGEKIITAEAAMLDNATISQLRDLRLSAMAQCFTEQQTQTGIHSLSFEERFGMLVEAEWLSHRNKRTERLVRQAGFRFPAAVEDIDYRSKKGIGRPEILRLSLGSYIRKAQNVFFSGPTGVGKTYLVCALGRAACTQGFQVQYIRLPDFFRWTFAARPNGLKAPFRDRCAKVPLLILDDWGLKKFSLEETAELSDLFERRYGRAATIVSGQVPSTSWHDLFPDPTQADSILDRIVHNAHTYNISGESMRKTIGKRSLESTDL
jgi:DNA replication protein DnaC